MDHHDGWAHWPPDQPDHDGHHDAADAGGDVAGVDAAGHHGPGDDGPPDHDPFAAPDPFAEPDLWAGHEAGAPDLLHDFVAGPEPGRDAGPGFEVGHVEVGHLVGADPDLPGEPAGFTGTLWAEQFPPALDLPDRTEPVDGYPWSDPDVLGDRPAASGDGDDPGAGPVPVADLLSYAGLEPGGDGVDPWSLLTGGDDPAAAALARWWWPGDPPGPAG